MADNDDRWRNDQDRYRYRDEDRERWRQEGGDRSYGRGSRSGDIRSGYGGYGGQGRDDDRGYIARRGFGNESAGYDRGQGRDYDYGHDLGRERDYGDSAGYGTGGSARDWRDVMGDDRGDTGGVRGYGRRRHFGGPGYGPEDRGYDPGNPGGMGRYGRYASGGYGGSEFGRGSREEHDERGFFERAGDAIASWFGDEDPGQSRDHDPRQGSWSAQHHRGRGPKGYQRSDERIREDVNDRLTDDPHVDASDIEVAVQNREVTLSGTVHSRFERRHAEDIAESVTGVVHVQNNLRVVQGGGLDQVSTTGASGATTGTFDPADEPGAGAPQSGRHRTGAMSEDR